MSIYWLYYILIYISFAVFTY